MDRLQGSIAVLILVLLSSLHRCDGEQQPDDALYTFIVQVSEDMKPPIFSTLEQWYASVLSTVKGISPLAKFGAPGMGIRYMYVNVFQGFAVTLTSIEALALYKIPGFISTRQDACLQLQTTRTPEFLGLSPRSYNPPSNIWQLSNEGDDAIVGVIDTGIWPERLSFDDTGMGPVPVRWKGKCEPLSFCNRKIIGARAFYEGYESVKGPINETLEFKSPRDENGHGTHTASTVAGRLVNNASVFGFGSGVATGMAPKARLAIYKACWATGCYNSDILAAFDAAVGDGVDIISLSLGGRPKYHYEDYIAIAAFGAMEKGILTSASAGNNGPNSLSVGSTAPWILTVAASTLDRNFLATVTLGNGRTFTGSSLFSGNTIAVNGQQFPLVYAGDVAFPGGNNSNASFCLRDTLDPALVANKIVVCNRGRSSNPMHAEIVKLAGGVATIIANLETSGETLPANSFTSPATVVGFKAGQAIKEYITTTLEPTAALTFEGTMVGVKPAPSMAAFSSRGPNPIVAEILKPDITAPGVNILAAWTGYVGPTDLPNENRTVDFNIISGTSMSCPHISGLAALLKRIHSDWSASAIKSALMTTSTVVDNTGAPISDGAFGQNYLSNPFVHGAGHVVPFAAMDPGLVYDLNIQNYIDYLCSLNYSTNQLRLFTKGQHQCNNSTINFRPGDLNYPSFSVIYFQRLLPLFSATYSRTLLNVDMANSTYIVDVLPPNGVKVTVEPTILYFSHIHEKLTYNVTFEASPIIISSRQAASYGSLEWKDANHVVKSPIAFLWDNTV